MEGLEIIGKAFVFQSKRLLCFLPLLLLMSHWETLMPTMWHALNGFFEGPVFAFLLLNCLIVTIIARGSHEEESKGESMRESERGDEGAAFTAENIAIGQNHNSSTKYAYDYMNEGKNSLSSSCSLDSNYRNKIKQEPTNVNLNEKKPIRRAARLTCRGSDKVRLHPNKPLTEKKLIRGSFSLHDHENPALHKNCHDIVEEKSLKRLGHAGNTIDHRPRQALNSAAAAMAHPSLEEVWAAINESNARMASMQAEKPQPRPAAATDAGSSQQPAAAAPAPPVASRTPPAAAAAAPTNPSGVPSKAHAAAIEKHEDGDDQENDSELEELNRRAEEFIARFNQQMRLQRQESLQRQKGGRPRPCNYDIQYTHHVQLAARGLLVG